MGIAIVARMRAKSAIVGALGLCGLWTSGPLMALPGDGSGAQSWMVNGRSVLPPVTLYDGGPKKWSFGLYYGDQQRDLVTDALPKPVELDIVHIWGFVGYDATPWLTFQVAAGSADPSSPGHAAMRSSTEWAVGARWRIMDYLFVSEDPFRFEINADAQYSQAIPKNDPVKTDWDELSASLTIAFMTDPRRGTLMMKSIGIYGGAGFSSLKATSTSRSETVSFKGDKSVGLIGGLVYNPTEYWLVKVEVQQFEHMSFGVNVGLHF